MLRTRSITLLLVVLALVSWASTASAQVLTALPSSWSPTYAKGAGTDLPTSLAISIAAGGPQAYTVGTTPALPSWLTVSCGGSVADASDPDTCVLTIVASVADHMAAGSYSFNVLLQISGSTDTTVPVALTITSATSPLSSTAVTLGYVLGGVANQTAAKVVATVSSNDTAYDTYTVSAGYASWLTVTPAAGKAKLGTTDSCTFTVVQSAANLLSAGAATTNVHFAVSGQPDLVLTVTLNALAAQPLTTTTTALDFSFVKGGSTPAAQTAVVKVGTGTMNFTVDSATVPLWLTVSPSSGTANTTSGQTVTFTPAGTVITGLAAGNYNGSVGFLATGAASELTIPVVLTVSNTAATVSVLQTPSTISSIYNPGTTVPAPLVTVLSSNEPVAFSATCAVTTTNPTYVPIPTTCQLSGASTAASTVTGVAYTFGTPLTTIFDSNLFGAGTPYGTVITLTVTVTAGTQSPVVETYKYTVQPVAPTFTALSPTSANEIAVGTTLVVTLTGTNFVSPGNIVAGSSLSPTRVYVGGTDLTASSVVWSPTTIVVSVPQTAFPTLGSAKTVNMVVGVANQTGASAPTAAQVTQNLVITTAPVVYSVASTATYNQPLPGAKPIVAPYELVSIFGANFGATGPDNGTLNSYSKFGTTVNISGAGTTLSPYVTLSVSFKDGTTTYPAPILFANATQINCIVPSGLPLSSTATVTVTSGTSSSDGLFPVSVVVADPGIFTLSSEGVGQGAILNPDYSVNKVGNEATAGQIVAIYVTGLGTPNSTATDSAANAGGYPAGCVQVSNTTTGTPGYLQVVNTTTKTPAYTAPATPWTNIDGAVINSAMLLGSALPPCFTNAAATAVSVTFGSGVNAVTQSGAGEIYWAGFAGGSVAGLYQINVKVPAGLATSGATTVPVMVTLGTEGHSPAGVVTMAVK